MPTLTIRQAKRLALVRAGLLRPALTGLPDCAGGHDRYARFVCNRIIDRFGYLQLDSVAVTGARSHAIVLASRLRGLRAGVVETLLAPREPLFEYWGHEACWMPISLYPYFRFRREQYSKRHTWPGSTMHEHKALVKRVLSRIENDGPLRSIDLEGEPTTEVWGAKLSTRVLESLWSVGILAVSQRVKFQRTFDLAERVIPDEVRNMPISSQDCFDKLLLKALEGHGWATTGTLAATWRLSNCRTEIASSLDRLVDRGEVISCHLKTTQSSIAGWVRPVDLELAHQLEKIRPRKSQGIALSPFDPILWDRARCVLLFGFHQVLEIYKPVEKRRYGYYCLPILAGDRLVARVDLRSDWHQDRLNVLSCHYEDRVGVQGQRAVKSALKRFSQSVGLSNICM